MQACNELACIPGIGLASHSGCSNPQESQNDACELGWPPNSSQTKIPTHYLMPQCHPKKTHTNAMSRHKTQCLDIKRNVCTSLTQGIPLYKGQRNVYTYKTMSVLKKNKTMSILQNLCLDFVFGGFELSVKMSSRAPPHRELFIRNSS